jgi:hypothetical protein
MSGVQYQLDCWKRLRKRSSFMASGLQFADIEDQMQLGTTRCTDCSDARAYGGSLVGYLGRANASSHWASSSLSRHLAAWLVVFSRYALATFSLYTAFRKA